MTGPGSSPSTGPDLAALREALSHLDRAATSIGCVTYHGERLSAGARDTIVSETRTVLSLVDDLRAEVARWHAACDAVGVPHDPDVLIRHHRGNEAATVGANAYTERFRLQAENERLREALEEYGGHMDTCATRSVLKVLRCDCGWPETRAALAGPPAANEEDTDA